MDDYPTLHVIAGPNGAGKTSLYHLRLSKRFPNAEFVNADELAKQHYGHAAQTLEESRTGQQLAEDRRNTLMAERKSFVAESTFSHPSKLSLVQHAKAAGYRVALYHVNVRSANLSVDRVNQRVQEGGHPVPENKIRERYVRNQQLILRAAKIADRAYVYDNSKRDEPHRLALALRRGEIVTASSRVPKWVREIYHAELKRYSPAPQRRPAASFAEARKIAREQLGEDARILIARSGGRYIGNIVGKTELHTIQKIGENTAVAHFTDKLEKSLLVGEEATVSYDGTGKVHVQ